MAETQRPARNLTPSEFEFLNTMASNKQAYFDRILHFLIALSSIYLISSKTWLEIAGDCNGWLGMGRGGRQGSNGGGGRRSSHIVA